GPGDVRGAARFQLAVGQLPVHGQRPFAQAGALEEIFAQEDDDGDAGAAVDLERVPQLRHLVPLEEAHLDAVVGLLEAAVDGSLIHAVAAPRGRQHEHVHLAHKALQQLLLLRGEANPLVHGLPAAAFVVVAVLVDEFVVRQALVEPVLPVDLHRDPSFAKSYVPRREQKSLLRGARPRRRRGRRRTPRRGPGVPRRVGVCRKTYELRRPVRGFALTSGAHLLYFRQTLWGLRAPRRGYESLSTPCMGPRGARTGTRRRKSG